MAVIFATMGFLRAALSTLLTEVAARGAQVIVSRNGREIAAIIPMADYETMYGREPIAGEPFRVVLRTEAGSPGNSGPPDAASNASSGHPLGHGATVARPLEEGKAK